MSRQYETVIGLEVHVELATKTKIFCSCSTEFGGAPNTHTCPVCTGMPGSLPVLNRQVVEYALAVGLAVNCEINQYCRFDRKNYFYPDNPQNYQISQLYLPICHDGFVEIETAAGKKKVVQETRRWDDNKESSRAMRSKEDAKDYRYFPDPDLPPVTISDAWIQEIKDRQPELKTEKMARYQEEYGLSAYDADIITEAKHMADIFEATVSLCGKPKEAANWLMVEAMRLLKEEAQEPEAIRFSPENLAKLIVLVDNGTINRTVAKEVFEKIFAEDIDPEAYVEENGLKVVNDEGALRAVIREVIAANPQSVTDYHNGKERARGFLVGQTMRAMKGKADPAMVNRVLEELL